MEKTAVLRMNWLLNVSIQGLVFELGLHGRCNKREEQ